MSFTRFSLFNLSKPLAPCLIQALYGIALVLIALGLVRGIVGGVRMMSTPAAIVATQSPPPGAGAMPAPPPGALPDRPDGPRFGHRGRRFGGPRFLRRPPLFAGAPAPVQGGLRILVALFVAAVAVMVVRVLAEIANAILVLGAKARS